MKSSSKSPLLLWIRSWEWSWPHGMMRSAPFCQREEKKILRRSFQSATWSGQSVTLTAWKICLRQSEWPTITARSWTTKWSKWTTDSWSRRRKTLFSRSWSKTQHASSSWQWNKTSITRTWTTVCMRFCDHLWEWFLAVTSSCQNKWSISWPQTAKTLQKSLRILTMRVRSRLRCALNTYLRHCRKQKCMRKRKQKTKVYEKKKDKK